MIRKLRTQRDDQQWMLDLALNTFAQMALGRSLMGHIPNDVGGLHISIELTEPYVAAQALRLDGEELNLARVLVNDSGSGVMRHADAGYELAVATAKKQGLKLPMIK